MAKVLLKALDILALFDHSRPEWAEHEVAAALDLPTSTAHRLLTSLRSRGYVVRARSGRYRLGPAAMALGRRASNGALAPSLRAALERVASETGETAVVGGRVRSVTFTPTANVPMLEAELYDGSDIVRLVLAQHQSERALRQGAGQRPSSNGLGIRKCAPPAKKCR